MINFFVHNIKIELIWEHLFHRLKIYPLLARENKIRRQKFFFGPLKILNKAQKIYLRAFCKLMLKQFIFQSPEQKKCGGGGGAVELLGNLGMSWPGGCL